MQYTELQVTTNFSFLRGGSHPEEMIDQAIALGYTEIAITDHNTLAGVVRAYKAAKNKDIRVIIGCHLELQDGPPLLAYPTDKEAYARLSQLLSTGNLRTEKGQCHLYKADVYQHADGIRFIVLPPASLNTSYEFDSQFRPALEEYRRVLGNSLYLGANRSYLANDSKRLFRISQLSEICNVPMIATNDVYYHCAQKRKLQDVVTCIREKCTVYNAGYRLYQNAERYLKPEQEMVRLFMHYPDAIKRTKEISDACRFSLDELLYVYPEEITSDGRTPHEELVYQTLKAANERFGGHIPEKIRKTLDMEFEFMERHDFAPYILTVYDGICEANRRKILCQGRGSAANSAVCYYLGITNVDPSKFRLLFSRFASDARNEPPDIDVDFEHERREEMIQYFYNKYGRDRAGIVATVTQVHWKTAIRDVGQAMGLSVDTISVLSKSRYELTKEWYEGKKASSEGFDANDPHLIKVLELANQYIGFPRQLGQHTGGFVFTRGKLTELCPLMNARMDNRTNIEWNKDDIEELGFMKVDILALGMLTCIRKAFDLAKQHYGLDLTLANIPQDDSAVYKMITHADTIGVFQIESRAQMSMLPRLRPKSFYDLVIEVAIVRPGPIQGDMVHPYLRRRQGKEPVEYPSKELEEILGRTLGVPLFQEQAMEIAIVAAGFTPAEADGLRRSMATFKAKGKVTDWERKLVTGMVRNGYNEEFARRVFRQLEGFGSYGFPESHAASFALLVYISCWFKCYYPDIFAAALLNSQPMGFYQPAQIVIDARKHGVAVRELDVNHSVWDNTLEEQVSKYKALRLGFRQVNGLRKDEIEFLVSGRSTGYRSVQALLDAGVSIATLERLADADAFRSMGLDRRQALWEVSALHDKPAGLFTGHYTDELGDAKAQPPKMTLSEHVFQDYAATGLSIKAHPVSFVREQLAMFNVTPSEELKNLKDGMMVKVAGLVLVRQRPGTASGILFITIEDETGVANLVVFSKLFEKYRKEILQSKLLMVEGKVQIEGEVIHVIVQRCFNMTRLFNQAVSRNHELSVALSRADEKDDEAYARARDKRIKPQTQQAEMFPEGRNFR